MQKLPTRLEQLLGYLEETPNDPFILYALAKEYEIQGDLEKALKQFNYLLEVNPKYVGAYYHLGKLYEKLEQPTKAFFTYKKGMEVAKEKGDQHALSELVGAKLNLGDDDDFE
ncbi:MAG: tetratricopeptide repeat protein [Saprospiraceae bacterium]